MAQATVTSPDSGPALLKREQDKLLRGAWRDLEGRAGWSVEYRMETGEVLTSPTTTLAGVEYVFEYAPKWEHNVRFRAKETGAYVAKDHYWWWSAIRRSLNAKLRETKLTQHPARTALLVYSGSVNTDEIVTDGALTLID